MLSSASFPSPSTFELKYSRKSSLETSKRKEKRTSDRTMSKSDGSEKTHASMVAEEMMIRSSGRFRRILVKSEGRGVSASAEMMSRGGESGWKIVSLLEDPQQQIRVGSSLVSFVDLKVCPSRVSLAYLEKREGGKEDEP